MIMLYTYVQFNYIRLLLDKTVNMVHGLYHNQNIERTI